MVHLDLTAGQDVEAAAARAVAAGAVRAEHQPDPRWRVLLDAGPPLLHHDHHPAGRMTEARDISRHPAQMLAFGGE